MYDEPREKEKFCPYLEEIRRRREVISSRLKMILPVVSWNADFRTVPPKVWYAYPSGYGKSLGQRYALHLDLAAPSATSSLFFFEYKQKNNKKLDDSLSLHSTLLSIIMDSVATRFIQLAKELIIKYSNTKYNINDFKTGNCETMLLNQRIYYLNKSKSKWISVGLYHPFEFVSVVKIFGRSKQYVIFIEKEWIQFREQRENINKYFQTCDMMWKPRQIGSKTLTFEMIEEKKILRIEDVCGNEVYLEIQFINKMWMLYAEQHWTKAIDLKSAVKRLYKKLGALEFDADHEAIYGVEKYYTVEQFEKLPNKYKIGRKVCRQFLKGQTCSQCLVKRISDIGLQHFLDTIRKYIKDCSDSDTSSYSSDEEECKEAVEQNGEDSKTTEEEESKKSEGGRNTKPFS
ncbi:hypothetical protein FQA39_LY16333 [Lamprigera yunnana]|nr:hypothetical protein FQA39_LY16333 [Lamprigera yunnana]